MSDEYDRRLGTGPALRGFLLLLAAVVAFEVARRSGDGGAMYLFAVVFAVLAVVVFVNGRRERR